MKVVENVVGEMFFNSSEKELNLGRVKQNNQCSDNVNRCIFESTKM